MNTEHGSMKPALKKKWIYKQHCCGSSEISKNRCLIWSFLNVADKFWRWRNWWRAGCQCSIKVSEATQTLLPLSLCTVRAVCDIFPYVQYFSDIHIIGLNLNAQQFTRKLVFVFFLYFISLFFKVHFYYSSLLYLLLFCSFAFSSWAYEVWRVVVNWTHKRAPRRG